MYKQLQICVSGGEEVGWLVMLDPYVGDFKIWYDKLLLLQTFIQEKPILTSFYSNTNKSNFAASEN